MIILFLIKFNSADSVPNQFHGRMFVLYFLYNNNFFPVKFSSWLSIVTYHMLTYSRTNMIDLAFRESAIPSCSLYASRQSQLDCFQKIIIELHLLKLPHFVYIFLKVHTDILRNVQFTGFQ